MLEFACAPQIHMLETWRSIEWYWKVGCAGRCPANTVRMARSHIVSPYSTLPLLRTPAALHLQLPHAVAQKPPAGAAAGIPPSEVKNSFFTWCLVLLSWHKMDWGDLPFTFQDKDLLLLLCLWWLAGPLFLPSCLPLCVHDAWPWCVLALFS